MRGAGVGRRFGVVVIACVVAGCAGQAVRGRTVATDQLIAKARYNGAELCAPVELATAEVDNAAAQHELDEGNYAIARDRAQLADTAAHAAIVKSPPEKCATLDTDHDGIPDARDKCPLEPEDFDGFQDADGCPDPDNDGDGIPDALDKCPNVAEDFDGFQDADGCPERDNDNDGFYDPIDKCPNDPEDFDGFQDEDGCPDPDNDGDGIPDAQDKCPLVKGVPPDGCPVEKKYDLIVVTDKKIELRQTVYFDLDKATIKPVSFKLLDEVAQALQDNPSIRVEIQGHTDSQGDDAYNLKLSQRRAEAVRDYLVRRSVVADRLDPKGYGEGVPIADNRTAAGRAQNRRVEFVITAR